MAAHGLVGDDVDPALDEREQRLEVGEGALLLRRRLGGEQVAGEGLLHRLGVGRVDVAHLLLDGLGVDADVAGVALHGCDEGGAQPRHTLVEADAGCFAHGEVEVHLTGVDPEAVGERRDVAGQDRHGVRRDERQTHLGAGDCFSGQSADGLTDLHAEHRTAHLLEHRRHLRRQARDVEARGQHALGDAELGEVAGVHLTELFHHRVGDGVADAGGHRLDDLAPRGHRRFDPLAA